MQTIKNIRIYLADLVYDTIDSNFTVPLNIAYIAASVHAKFANKVEIRLFKFPQDLEIALKEDPPDVLGLSHYSWNSRLSISMAETAKTIDPNIVTVMGGPNIRTSSSDLLSFLITNEKIDYYVVHEGEEPFTSLIEQLLQNRFPLPNDVPGCARVYENELHFIAIDSGEKSREMTQPSPYLTGWLDSFISDPRMTPLFETNRGCPFGCTYCAWGAAALSKVRRRCIEEILAEIEYVGEKSAGQPVWIFCDANFGMLPRDVDIAKKIRETINTKGFPSRVTLWHSKNTGERNLEIVKIIGGMHEGYVAIQSTDPQVLRDSGRGTMKLSEFKKVIDHYREHNLPVSTDLLIGLPGETAKSHLRSICEAFDLGFDKINAYNIRLLPGTDYESADSRQRYGIRSKFRPIFGSYGIVGGKRVFEMEESVRETKAMTEQELDNFKVLHTLLGFCWNSGHLKPLLKYAQALGVNPGNLLHQLTLTQKPTLKKLFSQMRIDSQSEWFDDSASMASYYEDPENFIFLEKNFVKLYMLFLARIFEDFKTIIDINDELIMLLKDNISPDAVCDTEMLKYFSDLIQARACNDLFQLPFSKKLSCPGKAASIIFQKTEYESIPSIEIEIYRSKETHAFCVSSLKSKQNNNQKPTLQTLMKFLEAGGTNAFIYDLRVAKKIELSYQTEPAEISLIN